MNHLHVLPDKIMTSNYIYMKQIDADFSFSDKSIYAAQTKIHKSLIKKYIRS